MDDIQGFAGAQSLKSKHDGVTRGHVRFNLKFPVPLPPTWPFSLRASPMGKPWANPEEVCWLLQRIPEWRLRAKGAIEDWLTTTTNSFVVAFPSRASTDHKDLYEVSNFYPQDAPSFANGLCVED